VRDPAMERNFASDQNAAYSSENDWAVHMMPQKAHSAPCPEFRGPSTANQDLKIAHEVRHRPHFFDLFAVI